MYHGSLISSLLGYRIHLFTVFGKFVFGHVLQNGQKEDDTSIRALFYICLLVVDHFFLIVGIIFVHFYVI